MCKFATDRELCVKNRLTILLNKEIQLCDLYDTINVSKTLERSYMKKLRILMIVCLLLLTGCPDEEEFPEEKMIDAEDKLIEENAETNNENEEPEKTPYALPNTIIPDSINFPLFDELGYVLTPMTTDGDGVYREEFADKANISFGYTLSRFSAPYIMNGEEQTTEIVSVFTYSFSVYNAYNEKGDTTATIKLEDIYNNALHDKEALDTKYETQDNNSGDFLLVSYASKTNVETVWSKAAGDFTELGGLYDISYVTTSSPYALVIKMYDMPSPDYNLIKDALIQYTLELGAIAKEEIETTYEAYLKE